MGKEEEHQQAGDDAIIALQSSELRYRRLFETAKDGILILDAESGKIIDANPSLVNLLGYAFNNFTNKCIWDIGIFGGLIANKDKFLELKNQKHVRYDDLPLEASDGRLIDVELVCNVYQEDHLHVIQCNIRDITDRKRATATLTYANELKAAAYAIEAEKERLAVTLRSIGDGVIATDSQGNIQIMNRVAEELCGWNWQTTH